MSDQTGLPNPHRLPLTARPTRYDLVLAPNLDQGTFAGTADIAIDIAGPTNELVLHAAELEIDGASITLSDGTRHSLSTSLDPEIERLTCTINDETLPEGAATLSLEFRGILNDKLRGFYRSRFTDETTGNEYTLATTQFESTDARRAFPCWDEPEYKAVFAVSLDVADHLLAISNSSEIERTDLGNETVRVRFADTMLLSTYLIAFVVGPLESTAAVDVDGVPLRVVHQPGKAHLTPFALDIGASALRYFSDYYGIAYPGDKVDLVAIPDFAFGAMENLGCITFRETALLVDTDTATQPELERVADVVSHELAHMWFGDLVTMKWWNGIWLNEAFATFMEVLAVDQFRPDWSRWSTFALGRSAAFDTDSLAATRPIEYPVLSPADAEGMFDILTYEKGASVVRMLEQYLGAEAFRVGISAYLSAHAYANSETTDLWDALEAATGEPVRRVADTWIFQGGHPVVSVTPTDDGTGIALSQKLFRYLDSNDHSQWEVPIGLRWADSGGTVHTTDVLLSDPETTVDLGGAPSWVMINRSASGFYRSDYESSLRTKLAVVAVDVLDPAERYTFVDDAWASVLAGSTTAPEFLDLLGAFTNEDDLSVWRRIIGSLATLHRVVDGANRPKMEAVIASIIAPLASRLGDTARPGETERDTNLRASAFEALGVLGGDKDVRSRARQLLDDSHGQDTAVGTVDPALLDAAVRIVATSADDATFDRYWEISKAATTAQNTLRYLGALADIEDPVVFERFLALLLSPDVRTQDVGLMLNRSLMNHANAAAAWTFAKDNWDTLIDRLPSNAVSRMIAGVRTFTDAALAADVERFLSAHAVPQATKAFAQHIERMRVSVALATRERDRLAASLS